VRGFL